MGLRVYEGTRCRRGFAFVLLGRAEGREAVGEGFVGFWGFFLWARYNR